MKRKYEDSTEDELDDYDDESEEVTSGSEYQASDQSSESDSFSDSNQSENSDIDIHKKTKGQRKVFKKIKKPRIDKYEMNHSTSSKVNSDSSSSNFEDAELSGIAGISDSEISGTVGTSGNQIKNKNTRKLVKPSKQNKLKMNNQLNNLASDNSHNLLSKPDSSSKNKLAKSKTVKKTLEVKAQLSTSNISSANNSMDDVTVNLNSVGTVLKNKKNEILQDSASGTKKNCCYFCLKEREKTKNNNMKIMFSKLIEHYEDKHSKEELIKELLSLEKIKKGQPKNEQQKRRGEIISLLRFEANHLNNLQTENVSEFVVARRPKVETRNTVSQYGTCYKCFKYLSLTSLHKHVKECAEKSFKKDHNVKTNSRSTMGEFHEIAEEGSIQIISHMRDNDVTDVIRFDHAIFVWLNAEALKYESVPHHFKKTRADLSRLGRLKIEMMDLNVNITQFSDIFKEEEYDNFIKACKVLGKCNTVNGVKTMDAPATASDLYHLVQNVATLYSIELGAKNKDQRECIQAFLEKLKAKWHSSIGNTIAESQAAKKRQKIVKLPDEEDLECLRTYLENEMSTSFKELRKTYTEENYLKLRNSLESYIHMTNVKRAGEIERLKLDDLILIEIVGDDCRVAVRGKRTKPVPIVFTKTIYTYLQCLINNRSKAKISKKNPYVFSTINNTDNNFKYSLACTRMKEFSEKCGAKHPERLRGTLYRKKFATDGQKKGINEQSVQEYSSFMGHTPRIHNQNYRQGVFERDVKISKLIRESQTTKSSHSAYQEEQTDESMHLQESQERDESYNNENALPDTEHHKGNNNNPSPKIVKERKNLQWTQSSIDALLAEFPHAIDNEYPVPTVEALNAFIKRTKDETLRQRKEPQIRSWIHLQRKRSRAENYIPKRNNVPNYIYSIFDRYIKSEKVPSAKSCAKFLAKSPSKSNVSINDIQTWVKLAIRRKSM